MHGRLPHSTLMHNRFYMCSANIGWSCASNAE